jgi:hypothetical protein
MIMRRRDYNTEVGVHCFIGVPIFASENGKGGQGPKPAPTIRKIMIFQV